MSVTELGFPFLFPIARCEGRVMPLLAIAPIWDGLAPRDEATDQILKALNL